MATKTVIPKTYATGRAAALRRVRDLRREEEEHRPATGPVADALREARLDRIEAGKTRLWHNDLRLTQFFNFTLLGSSVLFIVWQGWALWAAALAAACSGTGMWLFAKKMTPREERLRRHIVSLAKRRRRCAQCGYRLRDLTGARCPECGTAFDPSDDRHILAQETLISFSARARLVSAVVIVFTMVWISVLAGRYPLFVHAALAFSLLVAFHILHMVWMRQAERRRPSDGHPCGPRCPSCDMVLAPLSGGPPSACYWCSHPMSYADVFIRPDVRRLTDRRYRRIQYDLLMLRWLFLVITCAGLLVLIRFDVIVYRMLASFGSGRLSFVVGLTLPVLAWIIPLALVFRRLARRQRGRLSLLFARVAPQCPHCDADVSAQPVGAPCPACRRRFNPADVCG